MLMFFGTTFVETAILDIEQVRTKTLSIIYDKEFEMKERLSMPSSLIVVAIQMKINRGDTCTQQAFFTLFQSGSYTKSAMILT